MENDKIVERLRENEKFFRELSDFWFREVKKHDESARFLKDQVELWRERADRFEKLANEPRRSKKSRKRIKHGFKVISGGGYLAHEGKKRGK